MPEHMLNGHRFQETQLLNRLIIFYKMESCSKWAAFFLKESLVIFLRRKWDQTFFFATRFITSNLTTLHIYSMQAK